MNLPRSLEADGAQPTRRRSRLSIDPARLRAQLPRQITAYLFLLPALITFALFAWYPMIRSIQMSFQNVNLAGQSTWAGLDNFNAERKGRRRS